jgi:uncharacterized protein YdhG (YjbR/CyaY superfamily)
MHPADPRRQGIERLKEKMVAQKFSKVEEYLQSLEPAKEKTVRAVIDLILSEFPGLETKIAWNVPQIHRKGKYVAGIVESACAG